MGRNLTTVGKGQDMNEVDMARLWKSIDTISDQVSQSSSKMDMVQGEFSSMKSEFLSIKSKLSDIIRLEERLDNHKHTLGRFGRKLEEHDQRLRDTELWMANSGDKSPIERLIKEIQVQVRDLDKKMNTEVESIRKELNSVKSGQTRSYGQKDILKVAAQWVGAIFVGYLIAVSTGKTTQEKPPIKTERKHGN